MEPLTALPSWDVKGAREVHEQPGDEPCQCPRGDVGGGGRKTMAEGPGDHGRRDQARQDAGDQAAEQAARCRENPRDRSGDQADLIESGDSARRDGRDDDRQRCEEQLEDGSQHVQTGDLAARQHQRERDEGGDTADHDPAQADPPPRGLPTISRLGTPEGWPVGECPVLGQRRHVGHRSRGARRPGGAGRCDQIHPRLLRGGKRGAPGRARCSTSQRGRRAGRRVRDGLGWGHADSGLVAPSRRLLTLPTHRTAVS